MTVIISTNKIKDIVFTLLLFVLAIANASPHIFLYGYQRPLYFIVLFVCIVITLFRVVNGKKISKDHLKDHLIRIALVILMLAFPVICGNSAYANRYLHLSGVLLYPIIYEATKNTRIPGYVVRILIIWSIVIAIPTILACSQAPYASRQADQSALYQSMGVGGYMYIYAIALGSVILFAYAINSTFSKKTMLLYAIWILYIVTIYKSNFMTAVLVAVIGAFCCIICKKNSAKNKMISISLFLLFLFFMSGPILQALDGLIKSIIPESGRIANIFRGSGNIFQSLTNEFVGDRLPTLQSSITVINKHPIAGLIFYENNIVDFGQHSTILDTFALWGIPIGGIYFILMLKPYFSFNRCKHYEYIIPVLVSFIILAFFNNIECTSVFVMFYIGLCVVDSVGDREPIVKFLRVTDLNKAKRIN